MEIEEGLQLREALAGLSVVEFPTFLVMLKASKGKFNIVPILRPEITFREKAKRRHDEDNEDDEEEEAEASSSKRQKIYTEEEPEGEESASGDDEEAEEDGEEAEEIQDSGKNEDEEGLDVAPPEEPRSLDEKEDSQ